MSEFKIEPLDGTALEQAAGLFSAGYAALRRRVSMMPAAYERPESVIPLLRRLVDRQPAVAAFDSSGCLLGFLGGMALAEFKGKDKGIYCPEWGHAVDAKLPPPQRRWIYRKLYEAMGGHWVGEGRLNQAITILAHDQDTVDTWFWNGFGLLVVDVVRDLRPLAAGRAGSSAGAPATVRPATMRDRPALSALYAEHEAYYNRSPIWLPKAPLTDDADLISDLANDQVTVWVAEDAGGLVLGMMKQSLGSSAACTVVRDSGTVACTGAYVLPAARHLGIGALLLGAMVDWAGRHGYQRVALDFEAANIYGSSFWLKHLTPVCYSVFRHVDDHILAQQDAHSG